MFRYFYFMFTVSIVLCCEDYCNKIGLNFTGNCFCQNCDQFNDCCQDKQKSVPPNTLYECSRKLEGFYDVYTISKCPKNSPNKQYLDKCESNYRDIETLIPIYSNQTGLYYKNIYCALCNILELDTNKIQPFIMKAPFYVFLLMKDEKPIDIDIKYMIFKPLNLPEIRKCENSIESCPFNYTNKSIVNLCENHTAYRYTVDGKIYKNEYCALCNNVKMKLLCKNPKVVTKIDTSLEILFDLTDLKKELQIEIKLRNEEANLYNKTIIVLKKNLKETIKSYLSSSLLLVSIISLSILIVYYLISKLTKNLIGKILINLSISLILYQAMSIVGLLTPRQAYKIDSVSDVFNSTVPIISCYITGVLTHYFYLSFFVWSNIMGFDLYRLFKKSLSVQVNNNTNKAIFLKCFIYGWLSPLVLVVVMNIKNYKKLSYDIRTCFVFSSSDFFLFYIIPVGLIMFLNLSIIVMSIKMILKISFFKVKYDDDSNDTKKKRLVIFLKFFLIKIIAWLFGLFSSLMNDKYYFIWYLFICLNSFQGIYLLYSYVFNFGLKKIFVSRKNSVSDTN